MKLSYKQRLFSYFLLIFILFTVGVIVVEQKQEKKQKTEALEAALGSYAEILHSYIERSERHDSTFEHINLLAKSMPNEIRISLIDDNGRVFYDKDVANIDTLNSHLDRPEIATAMFQSFGTNIRRSTSTQIEYIYYAKYYPNYYIRVAMPYNITTKGMLQADNLFIYIVGVLFVLILVLINYAAGRFGKSITQLNNFTKQIKNDDSLPVNINFMRDEIGEIGTRLHDILKQREQSKKTIEIEREKLIQHFQYSGEGLCIFSADRERIYANTHFMQYLNFIVDKPILNVEAIFIDEVFAPVSKFVESKNHAQQQTSFNVTRSGKTFFVQTILFIDNSFEVTIKDITKIERNRLLKQEMTSNIAHELKTPITSIRGYLETLSEPNIPEDKQKRFIEQAHTQSIRLSHLVDDIGIVSKLDESISSFTVEKVALDQVVNEVRIDVSDRLAANQITLHIAIKESLKINGNRALLYAIFRNLIDNSINYAGESIDIYINSYMEEGDYIYLCYYDTGVGVPEKHLTRLFERFYRIDEGRTRNSGGSGLGLSIVKNAVLFHKGEIQVKNRAEGGLEYLFTLKNN